MSRMQRMVTIVGLALLAVVLFRMRLMPLAVFSAMGSLGMLLLTRHRDKATQSETLSLLEARQILGLPEEGRLTKDEVQKAYHAMMQRVHPDKGGSDYLARQLNSAKTVLIEALEYDENR